MQIAFCVCGLGTDPHRSDSASLRRISKPGKKKKNLTMPPKKRKAAEAEPDIDPAKMKVADLKAELEKRSLDSSGKKADLVQRLKDAIGGDSTDAAAPPAKKKKTTKKEEAKAAEEEKPKSVSEQIASLKTGAKKPRTAKVDKFFPISGCEVVGDWDCMLNQTNIGHNNNKYYVIQLLKRTGSNFYYVWNRWGRVVSFFLFFFLSFFHVFVFLCFVAALVFTF